MCCHQGHSSPLETEGLPSLLTAIPQSRSPGGSVWLTRSKRSGADICCDVKLLYQHVANVVTVSSAILMDKARLSVKFMSFPNSEPDQAELKRASDTRPKTDQNIVRPVKVTMIVPQAKVRGCSCGGRGLQRHHLRKSFAQLDLSAVQSLSVYSTHEFHNGWIRVKRNCLSAPTCYANGRQGQIHVAQWPIGR